MKKRPWDDRVRQNYMRFGTSESDLYKLPQNSDFLDSFAKYLLNQHKLWKSSPLLS